MELTTKELKKHSSKAQDLILAMNSGRTPNTTLRRISSLGDKTQEALLAGEGVKGQFFVVVNDKDRPVKRKGEYLVADHRTVGHMAREELGTYSDDKTIFTVDVTLATDDQS